MLAYILAFAVGIGSLAIYLVAFFFPEIHRKNDFILSGVGLFYALILWVFSPRITGGLLLGHVASVALLWWFGWQTLSLRRQLTPQTEQTPVPSSETVKTSIQQQVVAALKYSCTDLSTFTANPDNWALTAESGDSAPCEVAVVGGDGGYIVLMVTPGEPYATLALSTNYAESTNALLYYSGCRGFTYDPDLLKG
jgi:hypothetical protein